MKRKRLMKTLYSCIDKAFLSVSFLIILFSFSVCIASDDVLKVRGDHDYPPFEYINEEGNPEGFNIDVFQAVADVMSLDYNISLDTWQTVREEIETGQADVLLGMYKSEEREKRVDFSIPHFISTYAVFVRKDSDIESLAEVKGKKIGAQQDDIGYDYLIENNITDNIYTEKTIAGVLEALSENMIEAALVSRLQGLMIIDKEKIKGVEAVGPPILQSKYCFAVTEGNSSLLSILNEGLSIIKTSGRYDEIYSKWFEVYEGIDYSLFIQYLLIAAIASATFLLLFVIWNRMLKKQVQIRTKALRKSEEKLRTLSNNLPGGYVYQIVVKNDLSERAFTYVSEGVEEVHEVSTPEIINDATTVYRQIPDEDAARLARMEKAAIKKMNNLSAEFSVQTPSGKFKWLLLNASPRRLSDDSIRWDGIAIDISNRKKAEEELLKAKEAAEKANQIKSEFLANVNHELRTPLNGILGFSKLLKETNLDNNQREYNDFVITSGEHLLSLINDILDLSKIEAGKLELFEEKTDLRQLIRFSIDFIRYKAEEKGIAIQTTFSDDLPSFVYLDPQALKQIMINLLSNAVKFTKQGTISISVLKETINRQERTVQLRFSVKDTGVGIKSENIEKIKKPFRQEDNSITRNYGGTGLGITIIIRILEKMNATLDIESEKGRGSTFSFTLEVSYAP